MRRLLAALALAASAAAAPALAALPVGAAAPGFTAKAALAGKEYDFDLAKALKKGPVVLYFFPAAFTSGCTVEAHDFAEATADFEKLGATVVGVTAGNVDRVAEFSKVECRDKFAVVADPGAKIAREYKATIPIITETKGYSSRTSYVISPAGRIVAVYDSLNPEKHVETTLAAVRKLKGS